MRTNTPNSSRSASPYEPPRLYQLVAPAEPSTARLARDFISGVLVATEHPLLIDDARLCVSDTVANVVQHARVPDLTIEVDVRGLRVITSIRDHDPTRLPRHRRARSDEERGRGLALVQQLSVAYGMNLVWDGLNVIGKCVWFELREGDDPR
ncbi:ATP-binding protein [Streptomyces sp. NPDC001404]|uniref:ATP-binding protein n=1 Tax=Streptomyces sp. NPDC001404 TaxID=3364571 RepID=UPI0036CD174E